MTQSKSYRCPVCGEGCTGHWPLMNHLFNSHLPASKWYEPPNDTVVGFVSCFCEQGGFARNGYGFGCWAAHLDDHGGLEAHLLGHLLGVKDG